MGMTKYDVRHGLFMENPNIEGPTLNDASLGFEKGWESCAKMVEPVLDYAITKIVSEFCSHPADCGKDNDQCYAQKLYQCLEDLKTE